jgi:putative redox protein
LKKIELIGVELTEAQKNKLMEIAAKCPVQRTIEGTPKITTERF